MLKKKYEMKTSFMYHCLGIREQECTRVRYEGGTTIFEIRTREDKFYCPKCGSRHVIKSGSTVRRFRSVPIGSRPVILEMTVQRLECKDCGAVQQEHVHFARGKQRYTYKFKRFALDLCKIGTILDVSKLLRVSWDTVKDILKSELSRRYGRPDLKNLRYIGIDEFSVARGQVYMTIVVDLETGRIVHVGEGKGADSLDGLWPKLRRAGCSIEAVSTDLSEAFISAVREHLPDAVQVYDHFHVVKLMNDKLDKVRRDTYNQESDENRRRLIKGQRWLLLANGDSLSAPAEARLSKALDINRPLATAYYLKESLRRVWWQDDKQDAARVLDDWIGQARDSGLKPLMTAADTFQRHRDGILAWYDYRINNGKLEGINNKIKTMKRKAYGYRDMPFFKLKLLSLHDSTYPFSG